MDKKYSEYLESVELPRFLLVKNLEFDHENDLDAPISRGEIIDHSNNYDDLKKQIPLPMIPEDDYKLSLFEKKFGELNASIVQFDDSPLDISEGEPNDYEIFGASYSILWICENEADLIIEYLLKQYEKYRELIIIWEFFIDRIHVYPFYSLDEPSDDFYENVCKLFEERVQKLKNPPTEIEWNELNDYL